MTEWTWWQTWTFLPTLVIAGTCIVAPLLGFLLGNVSFGSALVAPWLGVLVVCLWVSTIGQTVTA